MPWCVNSQNAKTNKNCDKNYETSRGGLEVEQRSDNRTLSISVD